MATYPYGRIPEAGEATWIESELLIQKNIIIDNEWMKFWRTEARGGIEKINENTIAFWDKMRKILES